MVTVLIYCAQLLLLTEDSVPMVTGLPLIVADVLEGSVPLVLICAVSEGHEPPYPKSVL